MVRILVADDDPSIRKLVQRALEMEAYNVTAAADGAQALAHIRTASHDLLVLDLNMPVMSGWELYERLREERIGLPIVVITAGEALAAVESKMTGVDVLAKPFDLDELIGCIERNLCEERRQHTFDRQPAMRQ